MIWFSVTYVVFCMLMPEIGQRGGTRGIGAVIAPSGTERKSFFFFDRSRQILRTNYV